MLPRLALTIGDPAGIGPELVRDVLARPELLTRLALVVIGPGSLRPASVPLTAEPLTAPGAVWIATTEPDPGYTLGRVQATCGAAALAALAEAHRLAFSGAVDAVVTAPINKAALHAAGTKVEGQTELFARWCGVTDYEMIGMAGGLSVMLLTRHMPLTDAIEAVRESAAPGGALEGHIALFAEALRGLMGVARPRIAVAGLNPHAGEGGILGREELDLLAPAVQRAQRAGFDVHGPISPDSVFHEALQGRFDGVLALYHDQAFIPLKLLARGRGVTVIAGLPYLRLSPMHGTAFDIAGKGCADPTNLIEALERAAEFVLRRR